MKKLLTMTVLGGLFAANTMQAQINIYIAGSTAFRANAYRAIKAAFDGGAPTLVNPSSAGTGTSVVTFQGTMSNAIPSFGANTVTVYASYNGSVQGIGNLNGSQNVTFTNITPGGAAVSHVPDITFSDVDYASTLFPNAPLKETHIAVLPFAYVKNLYTPASVTNVTIQQLQPLWDNGLMKLSYFTGNPSDDSSYMYVTGRNKDSGTRVTAGADAFYSGSAQFYGFNTTAPTTWAVLNQNISGPLYGYGYSSGGNEAAALTNANAGGACIGYLGIADATTVAGGYGVSSGGGSVIQYNGFFPFSGYTIGATVPSNPDFTPVIKGQYSFWSYENLETLSSHTADNVYSYYTNTVSTIDNDIATAISQGGTGSYGTVTAIRLSAMKVSRPSVGGKITPN